MTPDNNDLRDLRSFDRRGDGRARLRRTLSRATEIGAFVRACGTTTAGIPAWRQYTRATPITIVVLGMHRSGTSCITRMLNLCGAGIGASVIGANFSNKAGHWEPAEGVAINDALLKRSGGSWDRPPGLISCTALMKLRMRSFIGRLHCHGAAVWKDPRTVLTFPVWRPLIRRPLLVAVFRNPLSVAESLHRRDGLELQHGLRLWSQYNSRLLEHCVDEPETFWINFDEAIDDVFAPVAAAAIKAGLQPTADAKASYAPELRTSDSVEGSDLGDLEARAVYDQLLSHASAEKLKATSWAGALDTEATEALK